MSGDNADAPDDKTRYEAAKKELAQALMKKRQLDKQLSQLEVQIYNAEGAYLTETYTQGTGNIITGFDNYLKNQTTTRRRNEVTDGDRLFSNSSTTYLKSLELLQGEGDDSPVAADDVPKSAAGSATISLPARASDGVAKKERDKAYQRRRRASRHTSATGAESDDESVSASVTSGRRPSKRARIADDD